MLIKIAFYCLILFVLLPYGESWLAPGDDFILGQISNQLNLPSTEKILETFDGVGIPTNIQPFFGIHSTFTDLTSLRLWQHEATSTGVEFDQFYSETLLSVNPPQPFVDCWMQAFNMIVDWNDNNNVYNASHKWNSTLDLAEWEDLYWNGSLSNTNMSLKWTHQQSTNESCDIIQDSFTVETIMRIDVWPNDWFNAGYLSMVKNVPLSRASVCSDGEDKTIEQCFLDPEIGMLNAITTGVIVATGISRNSSWTSCNRTTPYLNSTSTSKQATPYIIGYVIRQLPWEGANCYSNSSRPPIIPQTSTSDSIITSTNGNHDHHPSIWASPGFVVGSIIGALVLGVIVGVGATTLIKRRKTSDSGENEFLIQNHA